MLLRRVNSRPARGKTEFAVRYQGGRKTFPTRPEASAFAKLQREGGGWAEVSRVTTEIIERKR